MVLADNLNVSPRDLKRAREQLVGPEKYKKYYERRLDDFDQKPNKRVSFNLAGFLVSFFWAFYRGMYLFGFLGFLMSAGGFYLILWQNIGQVGPYVMLGNICMLLPHLFFGLFGNYLYSRNLTKLLQEGLLLPKTKRDAFFKEYGSGNTRIVLGLVFAYVFVLVALTLSSATA